MNRKFEDDQMPIVRRVCLYYKSAERFCDNKKLLENCRRIGIIRKLTQYIVQSRRIAQKIGSCKICILVSE